MATNRYDLRGTVVSGDRSADFFFATLRNGDLYYGARTKAAGEFLRCTYHASGAQHLYKPLVPPGEEETFLLSEDEAPERDREIFERGVPLARWTGASERLVTMPALDVLPWKDGIPSDTPRRRHLFVDQSALGEPPAWSLRFWIVEQGRGRPIQTISEGYGDGLLVPPVVVRDTQPQLVAFVVRPDRDLFAPWWATLKEVGRPASITITNFHPTGHIASRRRRATIRHLPPWERGSH